MLGHVVRLWLTFWGNARLLYKGLCRFTFPPAVYEGSNSPHPHWYFLLSVSLITAILMVLISNFLLTNNAEYLFTFLLAIWICSLGKCLFKSFAHFSIGLSFSHWVLNIFTYSRYKFLIRHMICNKFPPSVDYPFTLFFCCIFFLRYRWHIALY